MAVAAVAAAVGAAAVCVLAGIWGLALAAAKDPQVEDFVEVVLVWGQKRYSSLYVRSVVPGWQATPNSL